MRPGVNLGKHIAQTGLRGRVLTYDELTVIPAQVLGVVIPFLENSPAETLGQAALWENIGRLKMNPEQARKIFDAGVTRGEAEATAYEWGSSAASTRDADFAEVMEEMATTEVPLSQRAFTNMIRSLFNIDGYLLPELTGEQQGAFVRDPVRYFIGIDKAQQDAIYREVMKRQPA